MRVQLLECGTRLPLSHFLWSGRGSEAADRLGQVLMRICDGGWHEDLSETWRHCYEVSSQRFVTLNALQKVMNAPGPHSSLKIMFLDWYKFVTEPC